MLQPHLVAREKLVAARAQVLADPLLARAVIRGRVNEVDPRIEGRMQDAAGLIVVLRFIRQAALSRSKAELGDLEARAA